MKRPNEDPKAIWCTASTVADALATAGLLAPAVVDQARVVVFCALSGRPSEVLDNDPGRVSGGAV